MGVIARKQPSHRLRQQEAAAPDGQPAGLEAILPLAASESWTAPVSGDWATRSNWSTGSVPHASTDVTVSVSGAYTITIDSADAAGSLLLNDSGATIADTAGGALALAGTLNIKAGTFALDSGGEIDGGTITVQHGTLAANGGTLVGVTYEGTLTLNGDSQSEAGSLHVGGGITLLGDGGVGTGTVDLSGPYGGQLIIDDPSTLDNATIDIGSRRGTPAQITFDDQSGSGGALILGVSLDIVQTDHKAAIYGKYRHAGDSITNLGTISATDYTGSFTIGGSDGFSNQGIILVGSGDLLTVSSASFVNAGSISVSGNSSLDVVASSFTNMGTITATLGRLEIAPQGSWTNTGVIIDNGAEVTLGGTFSTATLSSFQITPDYYSGSIYVLDGTLTNTGSVLDVGVGSALLNLLRLSAGSEIVGGIIHDGGLITPYGGIGVFPNIASAGGTFSGVTYQGTLAVTADTDLVINNGITLTDASGTGPGTIDLGGYYSGQLTIQTPCTLNNATINIGSYHGFTGATLTFQNLSATSGTLVLGPALDIVQTNRIATINGIYSHSGDTITNEGTITASYGYDGGLFVNGGDAFGNQGIILIGNNEDVQIQTPGFTNSGTVTVNGGGIPYTLSTLEIDTKTFSNTGTIAIDGGILDVSVYGTWTNAGVITAANSALSLSGTFSTATLNSIQISGGTLDISDGTLTNSGSVLYVGIGSELSNTLTLGPDSLIQGGAIHDGGLVSPLSGNIDWYSGGTLSAVTYQGTLVVNSSQVLSIDNGITLTGANGRGPGAVNLSGELLIQSPSSLNGATITLGAATGPASQIDFDNLSASTGTLTLGTSLDIVQTGAHAGLYGQYAHAGDQITNLGTIDARSGGGLFTIGGVDAFTNQGSILVNGETFVISTPSFANTGLISISGASNFEIAAASFTNTGTILATGGKLEIDPTGDWANAGTIIETGTGISLGGTFSTATLESIQGSGGYVDITNGTLTNTGAVLDVGAGSTLSDLVTLGPGGEILGGTIHDGGQVTPAYGNIGYYGGTLSGVTFQGTLTIAGTAPDEGNATLYINNGITLTGAVGSGPGAIDLAGQYAGQLVIESPALLDNAVITIGSADAQAARLTFENVSGTGGQITLGAGLDIVQAGLHAAIYGKYRNAGDGVTNLGTINASYASGSLSIDGTDPFTNLGKIKAGNGETVTVTTSQFTNSGSLVIGGRATLVLQPAMFTNLAGGTLAGGSIQVNAHSTLQLADNAVISTDQANIVLDGRGSVIESLDTATGEQVSLDQQLATIASGGTLTLRDGRNFKATANGGAFTDGGTLKLAGATFSAKSLGIVSGGTLSGYGLVKGNASDAGTVIASGGTLTLDGVLFGAGSLAAASGATLALQGGGTLTEAISGHGTLELSGASAYILGTATDTIGHIVVDAGAALSGQGTLSAAIVNAGNIAATGGTLSFIGALNNTGIVNAASGLLSISDKVAGNGTLQVSGAGTLSLALGTVATQTTDFLARTGLLQLANPLDFAGTIGDFGASDQIDLLGTTETSFTYAGGVLTVEDGASTVASLHFAGSYTQADFSVAALGGETVITFA